MQKNEEYIGIVSGLGSSGEGIIKEGNNTVFVPFTIVGEEIRYRVLKVKKNIVFAKAIEILSPSNERVSPKCPVFTKCGGCQLQHVEYDNQIKIKSKMVEDCLSKIAFLEYKIPVAISGDLKYGYRNKLQLPIRAGKNGISVGFFALNSHRIVEVESCPIQPDWCTDIIFSIKKFMENFSISAYDEETGKGLIRHVVVREVETKFLITVVINGNFLPKYDKLIDILKGKFADFSLFININKQDNNVILGDEVKCLYGQPKLSNCEFGIKYEVGPMSFMQVNDSVRKKLYEDVIKLSEIDSETVVIDAYSGAGLLTAIFAKQCKKAIGIEIVKEAVDCANSLRDSNGLGGKMDNICAPCEDILPNMMARESAKASKCVLVLDPPRQGVDNRVIEALLKSLPDKIVYISCSPQTLSRDLGLILNTLVYKDGIIIKNPQSPSSPYEITSIQPYDMFPQTKHVESVCVLALK